MQILYTITSPVPANHYYLYTQTLYLKDMQDVNRQKLVSKLLGIDIEELIDENSWKIYSTL